MNRSVIVRTGADRLPEWEERLDGMRIGLLTNPTGINRDFESTIGISAKLRAVRLAALFACEHGIHGERQAGVLFEDETDPELGIPVYSLYSKSSKRPSSEMLQDLDAVLFDIQDIGVRFYTYLSTLVYMLEACAAAGKRLIVLDRPNPLGGKRCEGGLLVPGYESMVGVRAGVPFVTGLTIGEFARFINAGLETPCDLEVIPLEGWSREMEYPDTGLPWILPSPNMPAMDTVRVYAGTCLFEGTNVSEGRGTTRPFEIVGAPWIDARTAAEHFNRRGLPGVHAQPVHFTPMFSKHQRALCGGVQLFVTEPAAYEAVRAGLSLVSVIQTLYPEHFEWLPPVRDGGRAFIDLLCGGEHVRTMLGQPGGLEHLLAGFDEQAAQWRNDRRDFLLYGEE